MINNISEVMDRFKKMSDKDAVRVLAIMIGRASSPVFSTEEQRDLVVKAFDELDNYKEMCLASARAAQREVMV